MKRITPLCDEKVNSSVAGFVQNQALPRRYSSMRAFVDGS